MFLLGACGGDSTEFAGSRLDEPYQVPGVALTDTTGAPYSLTEDTDRPLTLVFFGYTHCPDLCPLVMSNLSAALNQLDDDQRDDVDLVFVTTDPERDDEAALRDYLDGYGDDIVGLTGSLDTIVELGEPMHVYVNDGKKLPSGGYDLGGHTTAVLGIDASDEAVVVWSDDTSATEFANDIETLLEES
ncbi:protein SCO1/2 [Nocardioides thalensis]|uniref:Protein SCO1/2 n=1 Tax=Nocardioides thalensis TaxID=1914755 RepID=A0A853C1J1_9ACTN|nr:SCO family protein [Nocardioides thalensis]NYJ01017.1 protein SCO1/2 [Nocardioides thalensis]